MGAIVCFYHTLCKETKNADLCADKKFKSPIAGCGIYTTLVSNNKQAMKKLLPLILFTAASLAGTAQTGPTSYFAPRPVNPVITNKPSRFYTPADGELLYTKTEAPSSALHKANIDKIVFGKARINKDGDASQLTTVFHPGDAIYGRAFMQTSMSNYKVYMTEISEDPSKCMSGNFEVNYYIDGQPGSILMSSSLSGEMESKSTFTVNVIGSGDDAEMNNEDFIKVLNELPAGNHVVKLVIWATQGQFISVDPVAMGEFTFAKGAGDSKMGIGRSFSSVKDEMPDNAALKAKCLKKMNDHAKANGWKETFTEIKILDEDWSTRRNEVTSVIVGRTIDIAAKATWPDGHCTYQEFSMYSDYDGSAYSNAVSVYGTGEQTEIDCK
jgi:hypothetical protein